ncbi:MAG: hypothetical protein WCO94_17705 [Verrucomicrobiota bacterium]
MDSLAAEIEALLLSAGGFVPTRQICERFGIPERRLRQDDDRPGLLDEFAVSSTREKQSGYIHHKFLPTSDWLPIKHRLLGHGVAEIRRVRKWEAARRNCLTGKRPGLVERHTGQLVFL